MKTIVIANHKGGVGKTATTHALGTGLSMAGFRTLMVDLDPQASLTGACAVNAPGESMAEVMGNTQEGTLALPDILIDVGDGRPLHLAPSDILLAQYEPGLFMRRGRENILVNALTPAQSVYDVCLIDCPPAQGLLVVNALRAADAVIVPTQPQISDLRGLSLFLGTIEQVRQELNPLLEILGVLVTFYDGRTLHHRDAVQTMETQGVPLLQARIGRSIRVAEAATSGTSIIDYDPENPQAENYLALSEEVATWLRNAAK